MSVTAVCLFLLKYYYYYLGRSAAAHTQVVVT